MAEYNKEKKYWIQLKRDFFKRHDMMILESQPNGKEYELFYLKLMLESIDHNGELRFNDAIPYNETMLSAITNTNVDIVKNACQCLHQLGMIEVLEDGTLYIREVKKLLNYTTEGAERKQLQRQKKDEGWTKGGQMSTTITNTITNTNTNTYIRENTLSTDSSESPVTEKQPKHKYGTFKNVLLTDKEYENLNAKYPNLEDAIEYLSNYIEMKGYKAKNHNLALQNWVFRALKEQELRNEELKQRQGKLVESETDNPFLRILKSGVLDEES